MRRKVALTAALGLVFLVWLWAEQREVEMNESTSAPEPVLRLPELSRDDYDWIAAGIYQNEALGQSRYLTFWGEGEDFPSFGIGHFIWFPAGVDAPFDEMFPAMFFFVRSHSSDDLPPPAWMSRLEPFDSPWTDKEAFDAAWSSAQMTALRNWLEATKRLQARFIVSTFEQRWRDLSLAGKQKARMTLLLQELASSAAGLFAIIDYYNFKGLGVNPKERYQGEGWGLIQVLEVVIQQRLGAGQCDQLLDLFRNAAASRLSLRVELSPPERKEQRWMKGWLARLERYAENAPRTSGPGFRIRPYLQNPGRTTVTVNWFSNKQRAGRINLWLADDGNKKQGRVIDSVPVDARALADQPSEPSETGDCPSPSTPFLHEVKVTGLEAGSTYHYEVLQDQQQAVGTFETIADDSRH